MPAAQRKTTHVTDRALRYRANKNPPPGEKICPFCGSTENVEVGHVDGHEENCTPENLIWTCRSCNIQCGNSLRNAGLGRLTKQYNPKKEAGGAPNLGAWIDAVLSMKGESGANMSVADAVHMIHATPPDQRSRFAKEIWRIRKGRKGAMRNPHVATLTQGGARADVHQIGSYAKKEFEVIVTKGKKVVTEMFSSLGAAMNFARLKLHEVANSGKPKSSAKAIGEALAMTPQGIATKLGGKAIDKFLASNKGKKKAKKNPQDSAEKMYEVFHGFPSTEVLEYVEKEHHHEWLWGVGTLISMDVQDLQGKRTMVLNAPEPNEAKFADVIQVAANELRVLAKLATGDIPDDIAEVLKEREEKGNAGDQLFFVGGDQEIPLEMLLGKFGMKADDVRERMVIGVVTKLTYRTRKTFEEEGKVEIDFWHKLGGEHSKGVCPVLIYKPLNPSMELVGGRYFVAAPERSLNNVSPGIIG